MSVLRCKSMTVTRYASITLSGRVVACGNIIFKLSETTPNNVIGRCREKSLLICIGFNFFQLLSVASSKTVVYVTMDWLPLKCMDLEYPVARNGGMGLHRKTKDFDYKIQYMWRLLMQLINNSTVQIGYPMTANK